MAVILAEKGLKGNNWPVFPLIVPIAGRYNNLIKNRRKLAAIRMKEK